MFDKVEKNQFGFYRIKDIPSKESLQEYYANKYYQDEEHYEHEYSALEKSYILNKIAQKYDQVMELVGPGVTTELRLLDVGCGEGWTLKHFHEQGCKVKGVDFSDFGVKGHNPELVGLVHKGDLQDELERLVANEEQFDLILTDNVMEHVIDPVHVVDLCYRLCKPGGVLVIEVPNDFSEAQMHLVNTGKVSKPYWVAPPDHLSYFTKESLNALCESAGWTTLINQADFPIEFFLFNGYTNYIDRPEVGKACHHARIDIENLIHKRGSAKVNRFFEAAADLGLGRVITGFYRK